jgi:hypothetical protein
MEKITKEYCKDKILLFYPKTIEESEFIQRSLFALDFDWISEADKEPMRLEESVEEGIILRMNGTILYSPNSNEKENGITCTSAQFDPPFSGNPAPVTVKSAVVTKNDAVAQKEFLTKLKSLKPRITITHDTAAAINEPPTAAAPVKNDRAEISDRELISLLFNKVTALEKEMAELKAATAPQKRADTDPPHRKI